MRIPRTTAVRIYVATHAATDYPDDPGYVPIQVGRALAGSGFGVTGDDEGDSISALNRSFCELTALYWLWKNDASHIVGLSHYRRYFAHREGALPFNGSLIAATGDFSELEQGADIIVPMAEVYRIEGTQIPEQIVQQYSRVHIGADLFAARQEVKKQTPEYMDAFDFVMQSNLLSHFNMFVGKRAVVEDYCDWLFRILFALEKAIPYQFYDPYQGRVFGFLAERLFNVWLVHNRAKYRVLHRFVVQTMDQRA